MDFFKNIEIDEELRRNVAFQTTIATRDAVSLAAKQPQPPTYEQALAILSDLDNEIYNDVCSLIAAKNDNDLVKYYREEAKMQTLAHGDEIAPEYLVKLEIERLDKLKAQAALPEEDMKFINRKIAQHYVALKNMEPRRLSENRILNRDYSKIDRSGYAGEKIFEDDFYVDYKLSPEKYLRIRLLHPDQPEHIVGADLIYEQYDRKNSRARFVFLQYKTWDDKGVIYFSQHDNIKKQIEKMKKALCENGFCKNNERSHEEYRFPYCCGFLRPTDKLQKEDSKLISSGLHLPVCDVLKFMENYSKIERSELKQRCLSHRHFEELFNLNFLGSRWIKFDELEQFYKTNSIIQHHDTIRIFARELIEE